VLDPLEAVGVRLPRRPRRVERRLQLRELSDGFAASVGSFGETGGEIIPALPEPVPVVGEPLRDDLLWVADRSGRSVWWAR
jgi:hypothetical protein